MTNQDVDQCAVCKVMIEPGEGIYTLGYHGYVCSEVCQQEALDDLVRQSTFCDLRQLELPLDD